MTIEAVAVLQTIVRDEFERDWSGSEDFDWIDGEPWNDPPVPPVKEIIVELEGKSYVFPSQALVKEIQEWEEYFRYEVEEEQSEEDWHFRMDEEADEKVWERLNKHFFDQLDTAEEALAAIQFRMDYVVKGLEELVAMYNMIGERIPALQPVMLEKLLEAQAEMTKMFQEWIDENSQPESGEDLPDSP